MKLSKKAVVLLASALFSVALMSGCGKTQIGYIDGSRVMEESPQIKAIVEEGNQKMAETQQEAEQKLKDNPDMSQEDAQKLQVDTQRKLQGLNQSYTIQIKQKIDAVLADIAKQKKLDAVIDSEEKNKTAIMGATDVTDAVIEKLQ
ncbi:MAG: OmpH family outer membrane protein [Selenomonas sp.]|jgi:Skp family chaperone for outer membrane proteins|nr:OmpH family outer membrane protein [Selenomonas sp.]MCI7331896.1 OmpH family outer membrane protein [Selenomonadaceae bacterium]MDD6121011.1 OmpH family outer membrane protein [Selenomonadaceae bacterium]MDY3916309.1 OmpH family outer membrane protein [Selenomonadaceae bacterium]HBT79224.1 molecular chaperone Skp [Selenomonas sp.]